VGTFLSILRRDRNWGVGSVTVSREIVPLSIPNLHQKPTGLAPKVTSHCVSIIKGIFWLSSINCKGVGWVVVQEEGMVW